MIFRCLSNPGPQIHKYTKTAVALSRILCLQALFFTSSLFAASNLAGDANLLLFPANNEIAVNPDTRLVITFQENAVLGNSGKIRIYDASNDNLVDSLDLSIPPGPRNTRTPSPYDTITYSSIPDKVYTVYDPDLDSSHVYQQKFIGGTTDADVYHFFPVLIDENKASICLHNNSLDYNKTYYVQIDAEVFPTSDGSFSGINGKTDWTFSTKSTAPSADSSWFVVSVDGTGDFCTVQGALDFMPEGNPEHKTIFIKNGVYEEIIYFREKENITLLGESREKVIIRYANNGVFNYKDLSPEPGVAYHNIRAVFAIHKSTDIKIINFTIESIGERPAQAEGLLAIGENIQVHNITILGSGDALQATGTIYLSETSLRGYGDNVLGYGTVFFNRCELISTYGPHLWVRNTDANHGNVFLDCKFRSEGDVETDIARAPTNHGIDYPYVEAVLINCALEGVRARGWGDVGPVRENIHYWEYNSTNLETWEPADVSQRASYSRQLSMEDDSLIIANYSDPTYVLGGWTPEQAPMMLSQPDTINFTRGSKVEILARSAVAPKASYQWYKDGEALVGQVSAFLRIDSVSINDEGIYSASIQNSLGYDSSSVVTMITEAPVLAIDRVESEIISQIKIFPNPADNVLNIEYLGNLTGAVHGSIVNVEGKEVISFRDYIADTSIKTIDISSLKSGVYFVLIENLTQKAYHKLSIIR